MFCLINRTLYAILLLCSVAAVLALIMPHDTLDLTEIEPIKVAISNIPSFIDLGEINAPGRNIFDKEGKAWQKPRGVNDRTKTPNGSGYTDNGGEGAENTTTTVLGLVRLRGVDGVLTPQGFVAIDKFINGGKLVSIGKGEYTLDFEGQRKQFAIDENRERRRKRFESLGLPFLN